MTQQPYGQPPQGYPQPQQPGYAQPQYGQQPAPYQGQPAAQPAYAPPPQQQGYPPVGYPPQPQFQPPQYGQPPAQAPRPSQPSTVRDFWDQPTSGGKSLPFDRPGTRYLVTVIRSVTDADIVEQTDIRDPSQVATYRDGRPKKMMLVPVLLSQPTPEFPDGQAVWYVKGNTKGELTRAMEAAGIAPDPETGFMPAPRAGDVIDLTYTHDKPMGRGMNPMKVLRIVYTPGNGVGPDLSGYGQAPVQQPQYQPQQPQMQYAQMQPNVYQAPQGNGYMLQNPGQPPQFQQYPDPAQAYQQATGQPMPPQQQFQPAPPQGFPTVQPTGAMTAPPATAFTGTQNGPYGQPNADWNPYAQPQQPGPTAPPAPQGPPPGAPSTAPAAPSSPPPDWPSDVPFRPGLTVEQARLAALHGIPPAQ